MVDVILLLLVCNILVDYCVKQIENGNYNEAYNRYKNSILNFEKTFAKQLLENKMVKTLKLTNI